MTPYGTQALSDRAIRPGSAGPPRRAGSELEGGEAPIDPDQDHVLLGPGGGIPAHPGRIGRHPQDGDADGIGPHGEEAVDRLGGNVALDGVAGDHAHVTRDGLGGDAEIGPELCEIGGYGCDDRRALGLEIRGPTGAATSAGSLVDQDLAATQVGRGRYDGSIPDRLLDQPVCDVGVATTGQQRRQPRHQAS